jgi:hypothetical protein
MLRFAADHIRGSPDTRITNATAREHGDRAGQRRLRASPVEAAGSHILDHSSPMIADLVGRCNLAGHYGL